MRVGDVGGAGARELPGRRGGWGGGGGRVKGAASAAEEPTRAPLV